MTLANLNTLLDHTPSIAGLVCLGWEEVRAFVAAAEAENTPAALMVGPGARKFMPLEIWAKMLITAAKNSTVPLAVHLDHGASLEEVQLALDLGFSSVMYDGSSLSLEENIQITREVAKRARSYGASSEGEIGYVGYASGAESLGTDPEEAKIFAQETEVDFMAVSVGNVHLQTDTHAQPNWDLLSEVAKLNKNLAIHGGSGLLVEDRIKMARDFGVRKFNIGTEIRQVYGQTLRKALAEDKEIFDHLSISNILHPALVSVTRTVIKELKEL